jgi:hypothetical protein
MEKILVNASSNSIMLRDKTNRRTRRKIKKDLETIAYLNMQRKYATYAFLNISSVRFSLSLTGVAS